MSTHVLERHTLLLRQCGGKLNNLYKKLSYFIPTRQTILCRLNMDPHISNLVMRVNVCNC